MITADAKPIEEVVASLADYRRVLVLACRGCVTVCAAGGPRQAEELAAELRLADRRRGGERHYRVESVERQCDREFIEPLADVMAAQEAVLSLACGAGVQLLAELAQPVPVVPALNTTFLGVNTAPGEWQERCLGCGDCILELTGGICPLARCSKSLLNGPCGGSNGGKCEVDENTACAWQLIYERLRDTGRLDRLNAIVPPRDWSRSRHGGPRRRHLPEFERLEP